MLLRSLLFFPSSVIHQTTAEVLCDKMEIFALLPHRDQMEPGEEAEEGPQFGQQNAALGQGLQDAAVWTAPL